MLDYFCVFTRGGVLLWDHVFTPLRGAPVNALIRDCLLEERTGDDSFAYTSPAGGAYTLKWSLNNALGLVFVAVHQQALKLPYVGDLLERANRAFSARHYAPARPAAEYAAAFDAEFLRLAAEAEARAEAARAPKAPPAAAAAPMVADGRHMGQAAAPASAGGDGGEDDDDDDDDDDGTKDGGLPPPAEGAAAAARDAKGGGESSPTASSGAFDAAALSKKLARRAMPGAKVGKKAEPERSAGSKPGGGGDKKKGPKAKAARVWDDYGGGGGGGSKKSAAALDFTEGEAPSESAQTTDFAQRSLVDADDDSDDGDSAADSDSSAASATPKSGGLLGSFVRSIGLGVMGTAALTRADIAPALADLKRRLMERNVAEEIAEKVCESVAAGLEGRPLGSLTRVSSAVRAAVDAALTRILTPRRSVDVLREVRAAKARGAVYTIVFVGVNGVGKSTNLAKVAYWLLQNGARPMVAACDTFRSGAVEQLKTHCARLGVPLYERGYEKDPAKVAAEAKRAAAAGGADVLLVDTAGRMQDNEPLMRALANLLALNAPDLVLFVGEALVGNDAVDQLTKFNRRLADLAREGGGAGARGAGGTGAAGGGGASASAARGPIDGIVLTKFDTIDDKVGAALSMVYTSGAPIMFVGCGQTYVDLKRLNVKSVVRSLLG